MRLAGRGLVSANLRGAFGAPVRRPSPRGASHAASHDASGNASRVTANWQTAGGQPLSSPDLAAPSRANLADLDHDAAVQARGARGSSLQSAAALIADRVKALEMQLERQDLSLPSEAGAASQESRGGQVRANAGDNGNRGQSQRDSRISKEDIESRLLGALFDNQVEDSRYAAAQAGASQGARGVFAVSADANGVPARQHHSVPILVEEDEEQGQESMDIDRMDTDDSYTNTSMTSRTSRPSLTAWAPERSPAPPSSQRPGAVPPLTGTQFPPVPTSAQRSAERSGRSTAADAAATAASSAAQTPGRPSSTAPSHEMGNFLAAASPHSSARVMMSDDTLTLSPFPSHRSGVFSQRSGATSGAGPRGLDWPDSPGSHRMDLVDADFDSSYAGSTVMSPPVSARRTH